MNNRYSNPEQLVIRHPSIFEKAKKNSSLDKMTLPRDNPVKDFLKSADKKFENFKKDSKFFSILFIIWDDFIYEPISAINGNPSGLFQTGSFARNSDDERLKFPNVDAVFLDRHLIQFIKATRSQSLLHNKKHAMDYGLINEFPHKIIIPCPDSKIAKDIPHEILECFQVVEPSPSLGAEYCATDFVYWL